MKRFNYIDVRLKSCEYLSYEHFKLSNRLKLDESRIRCAVLTYSYKRELDTLQGIRRLLIVELSLSYETIKGGESND